MADHGIPKSPKESLESLARSARTPAAPVKKGVAAKGAAGAMPRRAGISRGYRLVSPLLLLMGILLLGVGGWAVGAVLYMQRVTPIAPEDIQYPLLQWSDTVGTSGGYAPESRLMAYGMLACIPVALVMLATALVIRRQVRARRQASR